MRKNWKLNFENKIFCKARNRFSKILISRLFVKIDFTALGFHGDYLSALELIVLYFISLLRLQGLMGLFNSFHGVKTHDF